MEVFQTSRACWRNGAGPNPRWRGWRPPLPRCNCRTGDRAVDLADRRRRALLKPRGLLTHSQEAKVDALKSGWPDFAAMRQLAVRFCGILQSKNVAKLGAWLKDAQQSGHYAIQRFARTMRRDIVAVRNAVTAPWSNGQTEGQINRLKTLKRSMYGRGGASAGAELPL